MERSAKSNFVLTVIALALIGIGFFAWAHAQVAGVTLPTVPGNVSAAAQSTPGQVDVSWSASTESSGTIEGYYVYRNGTQVANTAGTSIVDAGLSPGYYSYTVEAYDENGYQSQASTPVMITLVLDKTPPTTPTGVTITGATSTNSYYAQVPITISWNQSTDSIGVAGYYVYRNGVPITSTTSTQTGTSIIDTVGPGTYTYTVEAYDAAQNYSLLSNPVSITITIDSIPPSVPTHVSAQQISASGANISWTPSIDPSGVAGYQIFRNGVQIASAGGPPYADSGLSTNVEYSYNVTAYDVAGNVSAQSEPGANVTIEPFNGPNAPIILGSTLVSTSTVYVSWAPAVDPLTITSYSLYRDGTQVANVAPTSTNYTDIGLSPGLHAYNLTATDVSGDVSPMSASSTVIVPVTPTTTSIIAPPSTPTSTTSTVTVTTPPAGSMGSTGTTIASPITQSLYYGLRNVQVSTLQTLLIGKGYLASIDATGFFGNLTLSAVEKFQCSQAIACTGEAGWGIVGPKTRAALNALGGETTSAGTATITSSASTSAMLTELQTLEAELAALEAEAGH